MGQILQNWRVFVATFFAAVLIVGSFMLARGIESPSLAQASTEAALLQAIAAKDTDGDGLSDWEEALYGTDPHLTDTFGLGMADGEAVARGLVVPKAIADITVGASSAGAGEIVDSSLPPAPAEGTLTAAFAKNFFALFVAAKQAKGGADFSESEMSDIANQAVNSLSASLVAAPDFKSMKDLKVSESSPGALMEFAAQAEAILVKNTADASKSEILYLQDAIEKNDATALSYIASIAKAYRDSAVGLAVLPVPEELAADVLALINAMMRVSQIAVDFTRTETDPLATILALQQYPSAVLALANSFIRIGNLYAAADVSLPANAPGASFVNLIENVAAKQQAVKKP